ncbi:MAG: hypothetical protein IT428_00025 [Planctomycetaceae bacterium]|nr:hypothetical protein [Planctomycetaceae bacterium]
MDESLGPVFWYARLFDVPLTIPAKARWQVLDASDPKDPPRSEIVFLKRWTDVLSVDASRDWKPVQHIQQRNALNRGLLSSTECRIEYANKEGPPTSWIWKEFEGGMLRSEKRVRVVDWEIAPDFADDAFNARLPQRSLVTEFLTDRRRGSVFYVIDSRGNRHDLSEDEIFRGQHQGFLEY